MEILRAWSVVRFSPRRLFVMRLRVRGAQTFSLPAATRDGVSGPMAAVMRIPEEDRQAALRYFGLSPVPPSLDFGSAFWMEGGEGMPKACLLYTSPSPRD